MKDLSHYIHIPFCQTICTYCNFTTFANKEKLIPQFVEKLRWEMEERGPDYQEYEVQTIYFGGGTPSILPVEDIQNILHTLQTHYKVRENPEISMECNPESLTEEKLSAYISLGINRISLGVQSLNQKTLQRLGRPHNAETIFKALDAIKKCGVKNFGLDIILGLPHQSLLQFQEQLEKILAYSPPHLSAYFLSYDTRRIDTFIQDCPEEEEQIAMYTHLTHKLAQEGFQHYEVSNYAQAGFECEHNQRYWNQKDYVGFGLGAHSAVEGEMWENAKSFEKYFSNPAQKLNSQKLDVEEKKLEYIMLHLRTHQGINLMEFEQRWGEKHQLLKRAETFLETKHLKINGQFLQATEQGWLILNKITKDLL